MKIKKINSYILINCIFVILAILSFVITFISIKQMGQNDDRIRSIGIGSIANYLRFLPSQYKNQDILELAFHNFGLAFIAYILSALSFGILGILSLCSAFSVAAVIFSSSPDWLTVVFTCLEVLGISLSVFGGTYIFNKRRRKNIIISSSILSAGSVFSFWCVFVPYFLILSLFFNSIANVSINALMLDKTDESNRGDALTLFYYASNIGKAIGPMLAGILFNRYAKLLLIGDAITTIISVIPIYIYVNDTYQIKVKKKVNKINFKEIYEYRYILIVMITSIILNIMYSQINYSVPICINSNFNQNSSNIYGLMITINCIVVLFLTLFIRPLIHNRNIGRNLFFANTLYLIGFSFMYIVHTYIYLYILTIVYTIGEIILELSSQIYIGDNTPTVYRGRVGSMIRFAIVTGLTLGPFLGALFLKYNSINNMYKFILLMWGIANVVIVLLKIIKNKQGELYDNKKM